MKLWSAIKGRRYTAFQGANGFSVPSTARANSGKCRFRTDTSPFLDVIQSLLRVDLGSIIVGEEAAALQPALLLL